MNTTPPTTGTIIHLMQCTKQRCGHVMLESEREWIPVSKDERTKSAVLPKCYRDTFYTLKIPVSKDERTKSAVCPKCYRDTFYTLNAQGQCRTGKDRDKPREILAEDINPSPRMGLKMRRRLFAAKNRALGIPSKSSL